MGYVHCFLALSLPCSLRGLLGSAKQECRAIVRGLCLFYHTVLSVSNCRRCLSLRPSGTVPNKLVDITKVGNELPATKNCWRHRAIPDGSRSLCSVASGGRQGEPRYTEHGTFRGLVWQGHGPFVGYPPQLRSSRTIES